MVGRRTASWTSAPGGRPAAGARAGPGPRIARLAGGLVLALALAGCTIPFGNGGDPAAAGQTPEETRRERSRRYQEEQERMQREMQFDRVGPPSDR